VVACIRGVGPGHLFLREKTGKLPALSPIINANGARGSAGITVPALHVVRCHLSARLLETQAGALDKIRERADEISDRRR
jgi:hypothetical protein